MSCYFAALSQNKAEAENPGLKRKHPCTFHSETQQKAHATKQQTGFKRIPKKDAAELKRWSHTRSYEGFKYELWHFFFNVPNRNTLPLLLLAFSASFLCFCCFYYCVKLFLKSQELNWWDINGTSSIFVIFFVVFFFYLWLFFQNFWGNWSL